MKQIEANIDTLVGPTHFYGGLAFGNIASTTNKAHISHPQKAALQGLEKMKLLFELGIPQLILPPHPRPHIDTLRSLGFSGSEQQVIEQAFLHAPELLVQCSSSSAMWTANSAIVTASNDSADGKVHITPANLASHLHRSIETPFIAHIFKKIFAGNELFVHHYPLPATYDLFDEGAANHIRFSSDTSPQGLHLFVWGRSATSQRTSPKHYPARQTKEAQEAIVRLHQLNPEAVLLAQQNPAVIDEGVFHNDVIATGNEHFFLLHEDAYVDTLGVVEKLQKKAIQVLKKELTVAIIKRDQLSLSDAVHSYLFNSQIVTVDNQQILIAPVESEQLQAAKEVIDSLIADKNIPINKVIFVSINQSMKNGGGPACLRLRLPLTAQQLTLIHPGVVFSNTLYEKLKKCIENGYPDRFTLKDLLDPQFRKKIRETESQITQLIFLNN